MIPLLVKVGLPMIVGQVGVTLLGLGVYAGRDFDLLGLAAGLQAKLHPNIIF